MYGKSMKYKTRTLTAYPRLVLERSEEAPEREVGFLQVTSSAQKIAIGNAQSKEFRLMQCLFSPRNFLSAKYEPVNQTYERVFAAIQNGADVLNARLSSLESAESEMMRVVEKSLKSLRQSEAGKYFAFVSQEGRIRMEIAQV